LLRLSGACPDAAKWPVLKTVALSDPSPYVRAAAVEACQGNLVPDVVAVLLKAVRDEYRLIRMPEGGGEPSLRIVVFFLSAKFLIRKV
jgi:hypothetical protein